MHKAEEVRGEISPVCDARHLWQVTGQSSWASVWAGAGRQGTLTQRAASRSQHHTAHSVVIGISLLFLGVHLVTGVSEHQYGHLALKSVHGLHSQDQT